MFHLLVSQIIITQSYIEPYWKNILCEYWQRI